MSVRSVRIRSVRAVKFDALRRQDRFQWGNQAGERTYRVLDTSWTRDEHDAKRDLLRIRITPDIDGWTTFARSRVSAELCGVWVVTRL